MIISFYAFYMLRTEGSVVTFILILLTCIATDIGGYMFGKILKGPKLTKISPNKTYAGVLGGFVLPVIFSTIYLNNLTIWSLPGNDQVISIHIIVLVITISLVSQIGDLIISFCKRKTKIKNTGKIIPGHGGILDRIDGMIFAFPYTFILLKIV